MQSEEPHLSDHELLAASDGELSAERAAQVEVHLTACWKCRARKQTIESAIADLVDLRQATIDPRLPPAAGARALLQAHLANLTAERPAPPVWQQALRSANVGLVSWPVRALFAVSACLLLAVTIATLTHRGGRREAASVSSIMTVSIPKVSLTPGAARLIGRAEACVAGRANNRPVPASLQRKVFEEYGIAGADPGAYEVDYLITPELGGLDDIHNLWPQSQSATVWNAQVKDALEDRLHDLICEGKLDLATAQRDLAGNWIAAYKKYFHTDAPIAIRQ